jgi:hypothetical protein
VFKSCKPWPYPVRIAGMILLGLWLGYWGTGLVDGIGAALIAAALATGRP